MDSDAAGADSQRLRHAFLVAQIALATVLVVAAGLLGRALKNASSVDVGYDPTGIHLASFSVALAGPSTEDPLLFARRLLDRAGELPSVRSAAVAATVPMGEPLMSLGDIMTPERRVPRGDRRSMALGNVVEPGYFAALRIPLIAGRDFTRDDKAGGDPVAIVGEATAQRLWPGQSAIGESILIADGRMMLKGGQPVPVSSDPEARTVIGVARDVKYASLANTVPPLFVYVPLSQHPIGSLTLIARSASDRPIATDLRRLIATVNPDVAVTAERTVEQNLSVALLPQRIAATVAGALGVVGLLLAAFGIHGVMAYAVARRTREIGIRVALGADRGRVARMLVSQGLRLAALGAAIGLPLAAAASGVLRSVLFGVPALDPIAFGATTLIVAAATLLACYVPAIRAMRVEPSEALRID